MARKTGSHSQITGPKIQEAALQLFARHGYAAVSMRQIASEVGVQAGALYNYVPDKQTLLSQLLVDHMQALLAALDELPVAPDPKAALEQFVRHHILYHVPRPDEVFISYMELRNLTPDNHARVAALRQDYEGRLAIVLQAGVSAAQFRVPDAKIASYAIIALLTGVVNWFDPNGRLSAQGVADEYWQMVAQLVGLQVANGGDT